MFVGQPNSTDEIRMTTDGINYNIPSNNQSLYSLVKPMQQLIKVGSNTNLGTAYSGSSTTNPAAN